MAGFSILPMYLKPFKTFPEQLEILKSRGLTFGCEDYALMKLEQIGYQRLADYWYPFLKSPDMGVEEQFIAGANFEEVISLYVFDKQLRLLFLDAIERIEVSLRVAVAHTMGQHDALAHLNEKYFLASFLNKNTRCRTDFDVWREKVFEYSKRSKEHSIQRFTARYGNQPPPIWYSVEVWDFGMLSTFVAGVEKSYRHSLASWYGLSDPRKFVSWIRALNYVRNICAHHGRLWNKVFVDAFRLVGFAGSSPLEKELGDKSIQKREANKKPFYAVLATAFLLRKTSPTSTWFARVMDHIRTFPQTSVRRVESNLPAVSLMDMGFPEDWKHRPLSNPASKTD